jgi:hypothetical protein
VYGVIGGDGGTWGKTIGVLKSGMRLLKAVNRPLVLAESIENFGGLISYISARGVRYGEKPYGLMPAKFAIVSIKLQRRTIRKNEVPQGIHPMHRR